MLKNHYKTICNVVCAVLLIALIALQFVPGFWATAPNKKGEVDSASLQGYIWLPEEHKDLEKSFKKDIDEFELNDIVGMPVGVLAFGILAVVFTALKPKGLWAALFAFLAAVLGVIGYLTMPVYQLGNNWVIHLIVAAVALAVSAVCLVIALIGKIVELKKEFARK